MLVERHFFQRSLVIVLTTLIFVLVDPISQMFWGNGFGAKVGTFSFRVDPSSGRIDQLDTNGSAERRQARE